MVALKIYSNIENVYLIYNINWNGHDIRPGDPVKVKRKGSHFRFVRIIVQDGEEILELLDTKSGKCRKFGVNQFDGPVMKRSQRKVA